MTIAEKSTELGIDLAQIALDANIIVTCSIDGAFDCYCAGGLDQNINICDENGVEISEWNMDFRYKTHAFTEETPLAAIQADFLAYINAQQFVPKQPTEVVTPKL